MNCDHLLIVRLHCFSKQNDNSVGRGSLWSIYPYRKEYTLVTGMEEAGK